MVKTKTHEEFMQDFRKMPKYSIIEVIGTYTGCQKPILCKCKIHNYEWNPQPNHLLNGRGCPKCAGRNKTHEEFLKDFNKTPKSKYIEILGTYTTTKDKILCKCKIDGYEWNVRPNQLLSGFGCPKCIGLNKTHEEFLEEMNKFEFFKNIDIIGKYNGCQKPILCRCKIDNHEWSPSPNNLLAGQGCPVCSGHTVKIGINDLWTTHPDICEMLVNPDDGYKYSHGSGVKLDFLCPNCKKYIVKRKPKELKLHNKILCKLCSDGTSYPEKFVFNVLSQLNVDFKHQKTFNWSHKKVYDFYVEEYSLLIEVHGAQHYIETARGKSLKEEQENDIFKYNNAILNKIKNYIIIDARNSEFQFIKNNILNGELNKLFDLSNIDWDLCHKNALKSRVIEVCELWNKCKNIAEISRNLKISKHTISEYLKKGTEIDLCNYVPLIYNRRK